MTPIAPFASNTTRNSSFLDVPRTCSSTILPALLGRYSNEGRLCLSHYDDFLGFHYVERVYSTKARDLVNHIRRCVKTCK